MRPADSVGRPGLSRGQRRILNMIMTRLRSMIIASNENNDHYHNNDTKGKNDKHDKNEHDYDTYKKDGIRARRRNRSRRIVVTHSRTI